MFIAPSNKALAVMFDLLRVINLKGHIVTKFFRNIIMHFETK